MNSQLFLCPYCKLDLSLINSFTKNNINTQILFHTNCNERNHTNFIKEKFGRFHCTKEQCETHKENLSKYQCITCQINFCAICKSKHEIKEPTHTIILCESKLNKKCKEHNSKCIFYCKTCQKLLCEKCKKSHGGHEIKENIDEFYYTKEKERLNLYFVMKQKQVEAINKIITNLLQLKLVIQTEIEEIADKIDKGSIFKQYDNSYFINDKKENKIQNKPNNISNSFFSSISNSQKNYAALKVVNTYKSHLCSINYIKEIKNNRIVTVSEDRILSIYDYSIQKVIFTISSPEKLGDFIPVSKDTKLAVISDNKDIAIFDLSTNNKKYVFHRHKKLISSLVDLVQFNYLLSGSYDRTICIWDYEYGLNIKVFNEEIAIEKIIQFDHNDQIAYYSKSDKKQNIVIYQIQSSNFTNKQSYFIKDIEGGFINLNDEYLVMYNKNNNIAYIHIKTGANRTISAHNNKILQMIKLKHIQKTNPYMVATISRDGMIKIWDIQKEQSLYSIKDSNHSEKIYELSNGYIFCISYYNMLSIYEPTKSVISFKNAKKIKDAIELVDGKIAVTEEYGSVMIYN